MEDKFFKRRNAMKKVFVITALVAGLSFFGFQQASAGCGMGGGPGMGQGCPKGNPCYTQLDAASKEKMNKFFNETKDLRKQMVMKHAEVMALMHSDKPDSAQAAKLAGEMFDLRSTMETKAEAAGVAALLNCGDFGGPCQGMGPHDGSGKRALRQW
jgi:zinc resistance-associated protein